MNEANRMAQLIKLATKNNQQVRCSVFFVDIEKPHTNKNGEPEFWIKELGHYVGFEEISYNIRLGRWYYAST